MNQPALQSWAECVVAITDHVGVGDGAVPRAADRELFNPDCYWRIRAQQRQSARGVVVAEIVVQRLASMPAARQVVEVAAQCTCGSWISDDVGHEQTVAHFWQEVVLGC